MPLYIAAILVMIVVDQVVKHWAFTVLQPQHTIPSDRERFSSDLYRKPRSSVQHVCEI